MDGTSFCSVCSKMVMQNRKLLYLIAIAIFIIMRGNAIRGMLCKNAGLLGFINQVTADEISAISGDVPQSTLISLQCATSHIPHNSTILRALGLISLLKGHSDDALSYWYGDYATANYLVLSAERASKIYRYDTAIDWVNWAIAVTPENRDPYYYRAIYQDSLGNPLDALASLENAIKCSYGDLIGVSDIYFRIGYIKHHQYAVIDYNGAMIAYDDALNYKDYHLTYLEAETYYQKGELYKQENRWEEATLSYQKALTLKPDNIRIREAFYEAFNRLDAKH